MLEITLGYARANAAHYNNIPDLLVISGTPFRMIYVNPGLRVLKR
jgi:hypothetical protein